MLVMKKVLSFLVALCMMASLAAVCTFSAAAANENLVFSFTEAKAEPGDTVDITVNIDQNPGFWSLSIIFYYSDKLTLRDISYGTITPEKYYFNNEMNLSPNSLANSAKEAIERVGVDTDSLLVMYVSAINEDSIFDNITGTGKLLTLSFEVAADAAAGDYIIGATIKDSGDFVDVKTDAEVPVEFANTGKISVGDAAAATDPTVNYGTPSNPGAAGSAGYYEKHPEYKVPVETTAPITPQTDDKGNVMTDNNGQVVPAETNPQEYYVVTDNNGEIVYETDDEGNKSPKTEKVIDTSKADDNKKDPDSDENNFSKTIAIVIGIVLVCAGAAGIIFVFATRKNSEKSDGKIDEGKADTTDKDEKSDKE